LVDDWEGDYQEAKYLFQSGIMADEGRSYIKKRITKVGDVLRQKLIRYLPDHRLKIGSTPHPPIVRVSFGENGNNYFPFGIDISPNSRQGPSLPSSISLQSADSYVIECDRTGSGLASLPGAVMGRKPSVTNTGSGISKSNQEHRGYWQIATSISQ
jgi:hypothetical protein